jgi:hypothetical protein
VVGWLVAYLLDWFFGCEGVWLAGFWFVGWFVD